MTQYLLVFHASNLGSIKLERRAFFPETLGLDLHCNEAVAALERLETRDERAS
jgi:hypothetical protein